MCKRKPHKNYQKKKIPFLPVASLLPSLPLFCFVLLRVNERKPASYISPSFIRAARACAVPSESAHFKKNQ